MSIKIDVSIKDEYYTQRNNKLYPYETCNTTSCTTALHYKKHDWEDPNGQLQDDDYFTSIMRSQKWYDILNNDPELSWAKGYAPNEVWKLLAKGINEELFPGKNYADMRYSESAKTFFYELVKGNPSVVGTKLTSYGHIVVLSGFETYQEGIKTITSPSEVDLGKITTIQIDDPFGNYHLGYNPNNPEAMKGFNTIFSYADFMGLWVDQTSDNKKLGIIIR